MSKSAVEAVLKDIETQAKSEFLPLIGPAQGAELERIVRERDPRLVVEVGVMVGYATLRIVRNLGDHGKIVGVEISEDLARRAEANIALAGFAPKVDVLRGDAREVLGTIGGPVDFVFMDAERGQYLNYLRKLEPKLSPGALIIAAGAGAAAGRLQKYFDHVRLGGGYESRHMTFDDDGFEVSTYRG